MNSAAIKYTEVGTISFELKSLIVDSEEWIQMCVQDTGIGIAPEKYDDVFAEYVKAHTLINKAVNSTGLGLPITKRLVELHKGTIILQSKLGKGSTFTVRLPKYQSRGNDEH